jgi:hypothetical protein
MLMVWYVVCGVYCWFMLLVCGVWRGCVVAAWRSAVVLYMMCDGVIWCVVMWCVMSDGVWCVALCVTVQCCQTGEGFHVKASLFL